MKLCCMLFVVATAFVAGCSGSGRSTAVERPVNTPFTVLDGYGEWIEWPGYGRVWQPRVAYDWQPFIEGRWVWTDEGWLWYSEEPFGWVVYHYGYWIDRGAAGWLWVPEYEWSPARVRWVVTDDIIGWAPLLPPGQTLPLAREAWVTVQPHHFVERNVGQYRSPRGRSAVDTVKHNDLRTPPDVKLIERATNRPIEKERIETERVGAGQLLKVRVSEKPERLQPSATQTKQDAVVRPTAPTPPIRPAMPRVADVQKDSMKVKPASALDKKNAGKEMGKRIKPGKSIDERQKKTLDRKVEAVKDTLKKVEK